MKSKIHYTKPSITSLEVQYAKDAAENGWGDRCYEYINRFEDQFKSYLGVKYAIATSSCTGALHMGMAALGIGAGDEVIMADINWVATASPIVQLGAKPIFVDILPDSWCIDPKAVERAITPRTKAIVAVHLYGNLCDMDELMLIGSRYGIPVIEDAAEAVGSIYFGRHAGSIGKFGAFSFHGTKTITTGEGGMFVTDDLGLYEQVLALSNHGRTKTQTKQFWPDMVGFKYKMSNIQAAIGLAQIERVETLVEGKRNIFLAYQDRLSDLPIILNPENSACTNGFWMPTVVVDKDIPFDREILLQNFKDNKIDGRVFFWPLSSLPPFCPQYQNSVSYDIYGRAFNLPSYHDLSLDDIERVCSIVKSSINV